MRISEREGRFVAIPVWFVERMSEISRGAAVLYLALRYRAGINVEEVPASMRPDGSGPGLAGLTGMSRSQVYRGLSELKSVGLIEQNGSGMIIKKSNEMIQPSPTGGTADNGSSPTGGTICPTGGTICPTGGNKCPTGGTPSSTTVRFKRREREGAPAGAPPPKGNGMKSYTGDRVSRDFLIWFANRFEESTGDPYPVAWSKEGKILDRLFDTYSPEVLGEMAVELLRTGDQFIREKMGRTISALSKFAVKFAEVASKNRTRKAVTKRERDGDPEDYETRIRRDRLRKQLTEIEERYGKERARLLHADLYEMMSDR